MRILVIAGLLMFGWTTSASAQDERRCCQISEGEWLDRFYSPERCRAMGEDFAPQGDPGSAMCARSETTEIPPSPPGAPGSPGGGPGGGDGGGGSGAGAGDGNGGRGGGFSIGREENGETIPAPDLTGLVPVQCERDDDNYCLVRFINLDLEYEEVSDAPVDELQTLLGTIEQQSQACTQLEDEMIEMQCVAETGQYCLPRCYSNLRSNSHLITQNAGRMRNDRDLTEVARDRAETIFETARALRQHADEWLGAHREESRENRPD